MTLVSGNLIMFDSITPGLLPPGADAYGAYLGGRWPTFTVVKAKFPGVRVLGICVNAGEDGEALDVEEGDATISQAPGWRNRQAGRGLPLVWLYASVSKMAGLHAALTDAHIPRSSYKLWSAHYSHSAHICGPSTCAYRDGAGRMVPECDGTQHTDAYRGINVDASLLKPDFFTVPAAPGPAKPQEEDVYSGQLSTGAAASVPVVKGTTNRAALFADFTTAKAPLSVRVAVRSAAKGFSQIATVALSDSQPHYVLFEEGDVVAVSFRREDTASGVNVGWFITGG